MNDFSLALIMVLFTFIGSFAAIQLKIASKTLKFKEILFSLSLYYGVVLYIFAAILNILVLNYWDYTLVLPLTSITYVWTPILAKIIFKEKLSIIKILELGLVLIGSTLII
jgi:drug/metabolite transporter (DMT)-like permease